ncbi:hypothetical protein A3A84_02810 [Candidatus Collierbacteria bacterium RIFCSPLOWO2_01_FULL_50_23]|nr:MAG: hypothetical protein A3A84_02810 [Candidatus Collierbacteria bacterium RIFCSPLOWO2_01_FULL_50_23]
MAEVIITFLLTFFFGLSVFGFSPPIFGGSLTGGAVGSIGGRPPDIGSVGFNSIGGKPGALVSVNGSGVAGLGGGGGADGAPTGIGGKPRP